MVKRLTRCLVLALLLVTGANAAEDSQVSAKDRVTAALRNIMTLQRPGQDGLATVWDGNKYVQCRFIGNALHCEAAGVVMQPSLASILSPDRIVRLNDLGWRVDLSFGNYTQVFLTGLSAEDGAGRILSALVEGYGADLTNLGVQTDWIDSAPCPRRNGPSQNLAGAISDAPEMAATAVYNCSYQPPPDLDASIRVSSAEDLIKAYGPRVAGEIERLRINADRRVFFVLDTEAGYVQCAPETSPPAIYCEAQSAEGWPLLSRVLTRDRIALLHSDGYSDPGRAPNYWRLYDVAEFDDQAIARSLLRILFEVYGYAGTPDLAVLTESG